jgi:hypothetical protein
MNIPAPAGERRVVGLQDFLLFFDDLMQCMEEGYTEVTLVNPETGKEVKAIVIVYGDAPVDI